MGVVEEVGKEVKTVKKGDRVVVPSFVCCGDCWFCENKLYSCCDNTNPNAHLQEPLLGYPTAGIYGYTHAFGGYAGSHAQYVRVPHADVDCFKVPDGLTDEQALFTSDAVPTGFMGADFCNPKPGDVIAVWGAGGVGLAAMQGAKILGAERVIAIDRFPERLELARKHAGAETINYEEVDSVLEVLHEMTGGRAPTPASTRLAWKRTAKAWTTPLTAPSRRFAFKPTEVRRCGKRLWLVAKAAFCPFWAFTASWIRFLWA